MPANNWQVETATATRYFRYCGIFNENLLELHC